MVGVSCQCWLANSICRRYLNLVPHLPVAKASAKSSFPRAASHLQVHVQGLGGSSWGCHQGVIDPSLVIYPGCDCKTQGRQMSEGEMTQESQEQNASANIQCCARASWCNSSVPGSYVLASV